MSINHIIETVDQLPQISKVNKPKKNNSIRNPEAADPNSPVSTSDKSESEYNQIELIQRQFFHLFVKHPLKGKISR